MNRDKNIWRETYTSKEESFDNIKAHIRKNTSQIRILGNESTKFAKIDEFTDNGIMNVYTQLLHYII